jgi:hypothetical protein
MDRLKKPALPQGVRDETGKSPVDGVGFGLDPDQGFPIEIHHSRGQGQPLNGIFFLHHEYRQATTFRPLRIDDLDREFITARTILHIQPQQSRIHLFLEREEGQRSF